MGGILSRVGVTVADEWSEAATFGAGQLDKLDVTAFNGDVLVQFGIGGGWQPAEGLAVTRGLFRSIPGLGLLWPPGPTGVRFKRRVRGVAATVNFDAFQL